MTNAYRAVMLQGKGSTDRLEVVELPLQKPATGQARIKVLATGAGFTDIIMRTGFYPYRPKFPFIPGYEVLGVIDELGEGVTGLAKGQRVCALTVSGGYAEYMTLDAEHFVVVPDDLDDTEVIALILNYVTAYQMLTRSAALKAGDTILVTGANGGVGTALLELAKSLGIRAIGAASKKHHAHVQALGGEAIESRGAPLEEQVRALIPEGVDAAFDGLGGKTTGQCIRSTRKGGIVVTYGFTSAMHDGTADNLAILRAYGALYLGSFFAGRRSTFYGITAVYRKDSAPFKEDLPKLFELLRARQIAPTIAARLPLLAAREAQTMLETGGVVGKIVHLRDHSEARKSVPQKSPSA